jgi:hypothetical protein
MRNFTAAVAITAAAATAACSQARGEDAGPTVSRNYNVGNFEQIELAGHYDVEVRTGSNPSVSASGPEKLIERLEVEVRGNELRIRPKKNRSWFNFGRNGHSGKVQLTVTVPSLKAAMLAGSGGIRIDKVQGDEFEGEIAGSGDLRLGTVEVQTLRLGIAGSGDVHAGTGRARMAEYDIAGSGGVEAGGVASERVKVSVAGSGDVKANATQEAEVDIVGSGNVEVTGGARCSVDKAGSGKVRCS